MGIVILEMVALKQKKLNKRGVGWKRGGGHWESPSLLLMNQKGGALDVVVSQRGNFRKGP